MTRKMTGSGAARQAERLPLKPPKAGGGKPTGNGTGRQTRVRYGAEDIDVLEGLEPVRRNPGMYVGGRDARALHHLAAEVLDNAMDEVVAGHATRIDVTLQEDGSLEVRDDGRGIPVDAHPRFPDKSAIEIVLTTLHAGGKFRRGEQGPYRVSGGLHGVGISVVNALSVWLDVEVARDRKRCGMRFARGQPEGGLEIRGTVSNRKGTTIRFLPDPEIFGDNAKFEPVRLHALARSKAYLFRGVTIRWRCAPAQLAGIDSVPETDEFRFPGGLADYLSARIGDAVTLSDAFFEGEAKLPSGTVEWALAWTPASESFLASYANAIATPEGGTHVAGLRDALRKGIRTHGELAGRKRVRDITSEDILASVSAVLSVFVEQPEFAGQTKERLGNDAIQKQVENAIRDRFENWLGGDPATAGRILEHLAETAAERLRQRQVRETRRKSATTRLRLPGKLADCVDSSSQGTELFLVEGDSAGGSAKQARDRRTQAVLPLRGKILNVASAGGDKLRANQELQDLQQALGVRAGGDFAATDLRYERVIIMTDADVDGAHIAALLMTFFFREMPELVGQGHLYLALPPLYRLALGDRMHYARDDAHRDALLESEFANGRGKVMISRFKGLGEMMPAQLRETAMHPKTRQLVRIRTSPGTGVADIVERLMGRKPEFRYQYICENARFAPDLGA